MEQPKISIIIPTYCCEPSLRRLMECLRLQTLGFDRLEIIFADDASPDETGAAIDSIASSFQNVKALHLPKNSGFAGAPRNAALAVATAPFLMFLDADDILPPNACTDLYNAILLENSDLATGYYHLVSQDGVVLQEIQPSYIGLPARTTTLPEELATELLMRDSFWCRIYKREIIEKNSLFFPVSVPGEDIYFLYSYLFCCKNATYIAKHVYDYCDCNTSVTNNRSAPYFSALGTCYAKMQLMFTEAGQQKHFPLVVEQILESTLYSMACSQHMDASGISTALPHWEWLFQLEAQQGILEQSPLATSLSPLVNKKNWDEAARFLLFSVPLYEALDKADAEKKEWKRHALASQQIITEMRNSRLWRLTHPFSKKQ